jgi:hypothetical protein
MYNILYTESYEEKAKKFIKRHPEMKGLYEKTFRLLEINPYHPSLRLHKVNLHGIEIYSVSINLAYRITIDFIVEEEKIIPLLTRQLNVLLIIA